MIPHITNEIKENILNVANSPNSKDSSKKPDIVLIEIGGTVGDIESNVFYEAVR